MNKDIRPSKDFTFMQIAKIWADRSTCSHPIKVGAVLVNQYSQIIAAGYNGSPRGMDHCDEVGCDDNGKIHRVVHAEVNAIVQCAVNGVSCYGASLYSTYCPCLRCVQIIIQAGISEIIYEEEHGDPDAAVSLLQKAGIIVRYL